MSYYYCISRVLNYCTDLGLSQDVWSPGDSSNTECRSSAGSRSPSCCRLAAAKPEARLLSLHLPGALTRNTWFAFTWLGVPSRGAACLHLEPQPCCVLCSHGNLRRRPKPRQVKGKYPNLQQDSTQAQALCVAEKLGATVWALLANHSVTCLIMGSFS